MNNTADWQAKKPVDESRRMRTSRVCGVQTLGKNIRRITLCGEDVDTFLSQSQCALPGAWIKAFFPDGFNTAGRAYTLSGRDKFARTIDFDIVIHGSGPASSWGKNVQIGQVLGFAGPGPGGFTLHPETQWLLLMGDESALPAMRSILGTLPVTLPVIWIAEVGDVDEIVMQDHPLLYSNHWIIRSGSGIDNPLLQTLTGGLFPEGRGQGWVAAEAGVAREIKQHLIQNQVLRPAELFAQGYWKKGVRGFRDEE